MSKLNIVNRALSYIGANKISTLNEGTPEANAINNVYDDSLFSILAEAPWVFALKRSVLTASQIVPAWGGGKYFEMPTDLVRIFGTMTQDDWRQEGGLIWTKGGEFGILYTFKQTLDSTYTPSFVDAFAVRLAADVSYDLTNSSSKQNELIQYYRTEMLPNAKCINAQGRKAPQVQDDFWVNAIYGG